MYNTGLAASYTRENKNKEKASCKVLYIAHFNLLLIRMCVPFDFIKPLIILVL